MDVSSEWVEAGDDDVDSQVVFVALQEMRLGEVLGDQVSLLLLDVVLLAHDSNALATTHVSWLQNVEIFVVAELSLLLPPLVVLWKYVSRRTDLEFFSMSPSLSLGIPPEVGLTPQTPCAWEVVDLLVLIHAFKL
jgi:hypothetical protein